jgi:hypothetical protein
VAASALHNLALYAIEKGEHEIARLHLSRALCLNPSDTETKVNLELVLKRIRAQGLELKMQEEGGRVLPGEQWRDMPGQEGESGPESRRSYL